MSDWPRPVVGFQINAKDSEKQRAFYSEMFDWDIEQREGLPILVIPPGKGPPEDGIIGTISQVETPGVFVYIQVANLGESLKQAEQLGGKITLQPLDIPNGPTIGQIADPEGNLVGLVQM